MLAIYRLRGVQVMSGSVRMGVKTQKDEEDNILRPPVWLLPIGLVTPPCHIVAFIARVNSTAFTKPAS